MHITSQKFAANHPSWRKGIGKITSSVERNHVERIILSPVGVDYYRRVGYGEPSAGTYVRIEEIGSFHAGRTAGWRAELRLFVDVVTAQRDV